MKDPKFKQDLFEHPSMNEMWVEPWFYEGLSNVNQQCLSCSPSTGVERSVKYDLYEVISGENEAMSMQQFIGFAVEETILSPEWEAMEQEADADIAAGRFLGTFNNPRDLIRHLRRPR